MNTPNTAGRKKPWKSTIGNLLKLIKAVSRYFPFTAGHGKTTLAWKMVIDDVNATNSANESGILDPKTAIERLLLEYESQVKNIQMATEGPSGTVTMDLTIQGAIAPLYERWDSYRNERVIKKSESIAEIQKKKETEAIGMSMIEKAMKFKRPLYQTVSSDDCIELPAQSTPTKKTKLTAIQHIKQSNSKMFEHTHRIEEQKERELQLRESKFNLQQEEAIERKQMHQDSLEMLRLDLQTRSKEAENTAQFIKAFMLHIQKQ